jgi:holin-like protein
LRVRQDEAFTHTVGQTGGHREERAPGLFHYVAGFLLILLFLFAGNAVAELAKAAHLPVAGNVIGMLLLLGCLRWPPIRAAVRPAANLLRRHMGLFFIPPGVGVMVYFGQLRQAWLAVIVGSVVSFFAVLLTVGMSGRRI